MRWTVLGVAAAALIAPAPAAAQGPALELLHRPVHPLAGADVTIKLVAPGQPSRVEWDLDDDFKVDTTTQGVVVHHAFAAGIRPIRAVAVAPNGRRFGVEGRIAVRRPRLPKLRVQPHGQGVKVRVKGLPRGETVRWLVGRKHGSATIGRRKTVSSGGTGVLITASAVDEDGRVPAVASRSGDTVRVSDARPAKGQTVVFGSRGAGVVSFGDGGSFQFNDSLVTHAYRKAGRYTVKVGEASLAVVVDRPATSPFGCTRIDGFPRASAWLCPTDATYAGCSIQLRAGDPDHERCELDGSPLDDAEIIGGSPVISSCTDDAALDAGGRRCTDHDRYLDCRAYALGNVQKDVFPIRYCAEGDEPVGMTFDRAAALTVDGSGDVTVPDFGAFTHTFDHVPHPAPDPGCDPDVAEQFGESCARSCTEEYWLYEEPPDDTYVPVSLRHPCGEPHTAVASLLRVGNADEIAAASCKALLADTPEADAIDYDAWTWVKITPKFVVNHPLTEHSESHEWDFWHLSFSSQSSSSYADHFEVIEEDPVRVNVPLRVTCTRS